MNWPLERLTVQLEWYELALASQVGCRRHIEALRQQKPDAHGCDNTCSKCGAYNGWSLHTEGACGELAFGKATGRYWDGSVNTFRLGGDVGNIQVRTRSRTDYDLIVRSNARPADPYVLVVGTAPLFHVVGWCRAADAMREVWKKPYGGREAAYFVPQAALRPPWELLSDAPVLPASGLAPCPDPTGLYPSTPMRAN